MEVCINIWFAILIAIALVGGTYFATRKAAAGKFSAPPSPTPKEKGFWDPK